MTTAVVVQRPRLSRRAKVSLVALLVVVLAWLGYFAKYGECDFHSKFCVLNIAGTRSEIGAEWDTWSVYVSTWGDGGNEVGTRTLIG